MQINDTIIKRIPDIGCEAFGLLCYLVSVSDGNLQNTVDYETMRHAIRASKSTVKAALEKLRAAGLVSWTGRFAKSNVYTISTTVVLQDLLTTTTIKDSSNQSTSTTVVLQGDITPFQRLSSAVVEYTHIPELTGGVPKWIEAINKLITAGVEPADVKKAVEWMTGKGYSITGPWSIINPAIQEMSTRKRNGDYQEEEHPAEYYASEVYG